jgi:hypothetical protein
MNFRIVLAAGLAAAPLAALAVPTDACTIVSAEEINTLAAGSVTKTVHQKSGNPSECAFMDSKNGAVLVITIREVQYAAEGELQTDRENLEKIYRSKVKWLTGIGENGFWMPVSKQLTFRKAKTLVTVKFARVANQTELDSAQIARMIDSRLK